jgi:hypothetical protein
LELFKSDSTASEVCLDKSPAGLRL